MASTDARPFPLKNTAYRVTFPILDADGDLVTGASSPDSEISKDGGTFTDCTNEATEIATSSGVYYLDLSSTEMNADTVAIIVKCGTAGAKTTTIVLYPVEGGDIDVDVTYIGGAALSTSTAQLGVNVVQAAGTAWGSGAITAGSIAADAITAAKLASDVTAEIQSGLATAAALATIDDFLDTEIAAILADTNELQTDWVNGGRLDLLIDAIKAKTDNLPTDPADDSDIDAQLAAIAAYLDTEVAAILAAVDTEVAAIKTKTDYLPSATAGAAGGVFIAGSNAATTVAITGNITGNLSGSVGSVTGAVGSVTGAVGSVTGAVGSVTGNVGGNVTGSVGSLAAQAKADVNAEVVDALATDTYAELGAVPAATASLKDKITWLYMLARNARLTTASADKVRNDANSSDVATAALSDDGTTFTRGEYA